MKTEPIREIRVFRGSVLRQGTDGQLAGAGTFEAPMNLSTRSVAPLGLGLAGKTVHQTGPLPSWRRIATAPCDGSFSV